MEAERKLRMPTWAQARRTFDALRHGDLISILTSDVERDTLDRVQAVMAVIEGHAEHVMDAVAPDLLPSLPTLRAALDRRRKSQSGLSRLLAKLLGLELKLRQYEQGKFFCDAIVAGAGTEALTRVFSGPEALPTLAELTEPARWLRRVRALSRAPPAVRRLARRAPGRTRHVTRGPRRFTNMCSLMSYHLTTTLKRSEAINGYHQ